MNASPSTSLPCPSALGATWDPALVRELAAALGREARGKAVDVLLAPTINLMRTPLGGRGFECFAEDPVLTAELAVAYVRGVQSAGVAATPKHFVGNDSETQRWTYDARIAEHVLRELYLVPFEAVRRGRGRAGRDGRLQRGERRQHDRQATPLLRGVLKGEWGFDGVVMSDWHAARSTVGTALAGLDLVMPGPDGPWGDELAAAVAAGEVSEAVLDDKVLRLLRLARRVGALVDAAAQATGPGRPAAAGRRRLAAAGPVRSRRAAAPGRPRPPFVLLRNEDGAALPLDPAGWAASRWPARTRSGPPSRAAAAPGSTRRACRRRPTLSRDALAGQVTVQAAVGCQTWESVPAPPPGRCATR